MADTPHAAPLRDDLGLCLDMLDSDWLLQWAANIEISGPDISYWSDSPFVVNKMRDIGTRIAQAVKEIGELRASPVSEAHSTPPSDVWTQPEIDRVKIAGTLRWMLHTCVTVHDYEREVKALRDNVLRVAPVSEAGAATPPPRTEAAVPPPQNVLDICADPCRVETCGDPCVLPPDHPEDQHCQCERHRESVAAPAAPTPDEVDEGAILLAGRSRRRGDLRALGDPRPAHMTQPKLACPYCGDFASHVRETEASTAGIERWRRCLACHHWYRTRETVIVLTSTRLSQKNRPHP